jgi:hypothetical protein
MPNSIALPMPYRRLTGHPKDGGVLTEIDHLRESRRMYGVRAFSLTEPIGVTHALATRLSVIDSANVPTNEGVADALASHVKDSHTKHLTIWPTTKGALHALAPLLGHPQHA